MRWLLLVLGIAACGSGRKEPERDARTALPEVEPAGPMPTLPDEPPPFPAETRSLRLTRTVAVRIAAGDQEKQIGTIAQDTRVGWTAVARAGGCKKPWVQIAPRGWVCGDYLEATERAPLGVELPRLDRASSVPGTYGKVVEEGAMIYSLPEVKPEGKGKKKVKETPVASPSEVEAGDAGVVEVSVDDPMEPIRPILGSMNVRKYGEISFGDLIYWKVSRGNEYVPLKSIRVHQPSDYQGVRLGDDTGLALPLAFVWPKSGKQIWVRKNAKAQGAIRQLGERAAVPVLETAANDKGKPVAYRIGAGEWVMADQVRLAAPAEPPAGLRDGERWFDVDLDNEILVAYEGTMAVYATMVSTGKKETPTPTGVWRMWKKISEQDMKGLSGEDPYSVATVPWTQFFDPGEGLALHAAYWHDRYGTPRSHGCVNLSPADARWLYFWSEPLTPPGWTMTAGWAEAPGSIVRVRSKADPNPALRGYATKVLADDR